MVPCVKLMHWPWVKFEKTESAWTQQNSGLISATSYMTGVKDTWHLALTCTTAPKVCTDAKHDPDFVFSVNFSFQLWYEQQCLFTDTQCHRLPYWCFTPGNIVHAHGCADLHTPNHFHMMFNMVPIQASTLYALHLVMSLGVLKINPLLCVAALTHWYNTSNLVISKPSQWKSPINGLGAQRGLLHVLLN